MAGRHPEGRKWAAFVATKHAGGKSRPSKHNYANKRRYAQFLGLGGPRCRPKADGSLSAHHSGPGSRAHQHLTLREPPPRSVVWCGLVHRARSERLRGCGISHGDSRHPPESLPAAPRGKNEYWLHVDASIWPSLQPSVSISPPRPLLSFPCLRRATTPRDTISCISTSWLFLHP